MNLKLQFLALLMKINSPYFMQGKIFAQNDKFSIKKITCFELEGFQKNKLWYMINET